MPKVNEICLISPYIRDPIVIRNDAGVTCGDVFRTLHEQAHVVLSTDEWHSYPYSERYAASTAARTHRYPIMPFSTLPPGAITEGDMWQQRWVFEGMRQDNSYTRQRLDWAHPCCFVINLGRPKHVFVDK